MMVYTVLFQVEIYEICEAHLLSTIAAANSKLRLLLWTEQKTMHKIGTYQMMGVSSEYCNP